MQAVTRAGKKKTNLELLTQHIQARKRDMLEEKTNSQAKNVAGKEGREEKHVNVAASPFATWTVSKRYYIIELWFFLPLKAPSQRGVAILGFAFMLAGAMLWVWSHEALVVQGMAPQIQNMGPQRSTQRTGFLHRRSLLGQHQTG